MGVKRYDSSNIDVKTGKAKPQAAKAVVRPAATTAQKMAAPKATATSTTPLKITAAPKPAVVVAPKVVASNAKNNPSIRRAIIRKQTAAD
jgi:hypothetical protein